MVDASMIEEIGDGFEKVMQFTDAQSAFTRLIELDHKNGQAAYKLGSVLSHEKNPGQDKDRAVEYFKQAIEFVHGETYK